MEAFSSSLKDSAERLPILTPNPPPTNTKQMLSRVCELPLPNSLVWSTSVERHSVPFSRHGVPSYSLCPTLFFRHEDALVLWVVPQQSLVLYDRAQTIRATLAKPSQ